MTKAELTERVSELEGLLRDAAGRLEILKSLNDPHRASNDPGKPVCISLDDGYHGILVYEGGATIFTGTETVGAVGSIPAEVLMEEIKWAAR